MVRMKFSKFFIYLFLFIQCAFLPAFAKAESSIVIQHPKDILLFADHLFKEGDYYRAITEYKRALFYFPTYDKKDLIRYMIGKSYYMGGKYRVSLDYLAPLTEIRNDAIRLDIKNIVGLSYLYRKDFTGAERIFQEITVEFPKLENLDTYYILASMAMFNQKKFSETKDTFMAFQKKFPHSKFYPLAKKGIEESEAALAFSPRYVWLATTLSAIFPGAGQAYNREWSNAFVSFVFNFTLGFLTVYNILRDDFVSTGIFGSLFVTFYAGNIYQARRSTIKNNQDYIDQRINALNKEFERYKFQNHESDQRSSGHFERLPELKLQIVTSY